MLALRRVVCLCLLTSVLGQLGTFDNCTSATPCRLRLLCSAKPGVECTAEDRSCFCLAPSYGSCTAATRCPLGESCASTFFFSTNPTCASTSAIAERSWLVPFTTAAPAVQQNGLTLSPCNTDGNCLGSRICSSILNFPLLGVEGCDRGPCRCMSRGPDLCLEEGQCERGESCAENPLLPRWKPVCFASDVTEHPTFRKPPPAQARKGLSMDVCRTSSECLDDRVCVRYGAKSWDHACQPEDRACMCIPASGPLFCDRGRTCGEGEVCATTFVLTTRPYCVSREVVTRFVGVTKTKESDTLPSSDSKPEETVHASPTKASEGSACVDVRLLQHVPRKQLVFARDVFSTVLCDSSGTCATPGHIVTFQGKAMLMQRYCDKTTGGCERQERWVNSPRFRRKLRVATLSDGLEITAFAARHGTLAEEYALSALVKIGL